VTSSDVTHCETLAAPLVNNGQVITNTSRAAHRTLRTPSWSFTVRDADRDLDVVSACSLKVMLGTRYPEQGADLERSFRVLRSLPVDIWVTSHARFWGRYRKFVASQTAKNPADSFVDPEGYGVYIDTAEAEFRSGRTY
jgi:metallo-beta-lactamase class B